VLRIHGADALKDRVDGVAIQPSARAVNCAAVSGPFSTDVFPPTHTRLAAKWPLDWPASQIGAVTN
jgi:hypothetical protein